MEKLISVIVPIYNVEKYLNKCIESIVNQTYTNLEIILVDDGSPDNCGNICDEWKEKDSRIRVIHKQNGGLSSARNAGLDVAKGEYIGFVDSDDFLESNMYSELAKALEENEADLSLCDYFNEDESGKIVKNNLRIENKNYTTIKALELLSVINYGRYVVAWNKLYKKSLFDNIRFPVGKLHEDQAIMHYIFGASNKITTINKKLYHYIFRNGSIMSASFTINFLDEEDALFDRINFYRQNNWYALLPAIESVLYWHTGVIDSKAISFGRLKEKDIRKIKKYKKLCKIFFEECKKLKVYTPQEICARKSAYSLSFTDTFLMKHKYFLCRILSKKAKSLLKKIYQVYKKEGIKGVIQRVIIKVFGKKKAHKSLKIQNNKIIFNNFNGLGYDGDPKAIADTLLKEKKSYDLVWLVQKNYIRSFKFPNGIRTVEFGSDAAKKELFTCKLFVSNVRAGFFDKRKKQKYIQTWHGGCALKKIERDCEANLDENYINSAKIDSKNMDYILSNSKSFTKIAQNSFWTNAKVLEYGSPREDVYFKNDLEKRKSIREKLDVKENEMMILYAPTFRQNRSMSAYDIDYLRLAETIERKFNKPCKIFIKLHPNVLWKSKECSIPQCVTNVTLYSNIQELLLADDILITDYSTLMFENGMLRKPSFLYASDLDEYTRDRNFYFDIRTLPYILSEDNDALENNILKFDLSDYLNKNDEFLKNEIGLIQDGNASEKTAKLINKICLRA